jgi:hypothetical protein
VADGAICGVDLASPALQSNPFGWDVRNGWLGRSDGRGRTCRYPRAGSTLVGVLIVLFNPLKCMSSPLEWDLGAANIYLT